jgi:hypothetical protein
VSVESDDEDSGSFDRSQDMDRNTAGMYDFSGEAKRSKLLSPSAILNNLKQKRENRGKKRMEELKRRVQKRKDEIENRFMHELYTEAAQERPFVFVDEDESMEQDGEWYGTFVRWYIMLITHGSSSSRLISRSRRTRRSTT